LKTFPYHSGFVDYHFKIATKGKAWSPAFELDNSNYPKNNPSETSTKIINKTLVFKPGNLTDISNDQKEFLKWVEENDSPFVIDLRNNGGGENTLANELARKVYSKGEKIPGNINREKIGILSFTGFANYFFLEASTTEGDERDYYQESGMEILNVIKEAEEENIPLFEIEIEEEELEDMIGQRNSIYKSTIVLWINKFCASACETFVEKLSQLTNVIVVGENTMGALHFGNPTTFELPYSKIQITLPYRFETYDNDAPEGVGYSPDIHINKNATILELLETVKL